MNAFSSAVMTWLVRISTAQPPSYPTKAILQDKARALRQGILLANRIRNMLRLETSMHIMLVESSSMEQILMRSRCAELLKAIEIEFRRRESWLAEAVPHAIKLIQGRMHKLMSPLKGIIEANLQSKQKKKRVRRASIAPFFLLRARFSGTTVWALYSQGDDIADDRMLDSLCAVNVLISSLSGSCSVERVAVLGVCMDVVFCQCSLRDDIVSEMDECLATLEGLMHLKAEWEKVCSCDFMYWNREILVRCRFC